MNLMVLSLLGVFASCTVAAHTEQKRIVAPPQSRDAADFFRSLSNGKDMLVRAEMDPAMRWMFDRVAEKLGITDGVLTREQFQRYIDEKTSDKSQTDKQRLQLTADLEKLDIQLQQLERDRQRVLAAIAETKRALESGGAPARRDNSQADKVLERLDQIERRLADLERRLPTTAVPKRAREVPPNLFDRRERELDRSKEP